MKFDYLTWFEVYDSDWNIDFQASIKLIQEHLTKRDPEKYSGFLKWLEKTELVLRLMWVKDYKKRVELLKYMYYWLRLFDDIADWDTINKLSLEDRKKIVYKKLWNWLYDLLIEKVEKLACDLWLEKWIQYSIKQIELSIRFDIDRTIDWKKYRNKKDLDKNFHKMDIDWTIYWTAIIFWLDPIKTIELLSWLWEATRISFNIKDLKDDIIENLINIPIEDLTRHWITKEDIDKVKNWIITENINNWIQDEITKIHLLLKNYNNNYSLFNILRWQWIDSKNNTTYFRKVFNNLLLKYVVLPKWYIKEIEKVVEKYEK